MWNDQRPIEPQFIALAKFLFGYAYGLPGKAVERKEQREQLVFATLHSYLPFDSRVDPGRETSQRMIKAKSEELALAALEAKGEPPVTIDAKATAAEDDAEVLEVVVPPPAPEDPRAFGGR
jgi:hypothetical protein